MNCRFRPYGDTEETTNHIISEGKWKNGICTTLNLSWIIKHTKSSMKLLIQTDYLISARWPDLVIVIKKQEKEKKTSLMLNFSVPHWPHDKTEGSRKRIENLWNMKVTLMPIVIRVLDAVTKVLVTGWEDLGIKHVETIQTTAVLRWARIRRKILETCGSLLLLSHYRKPISWHSCKKFSNE